MKIRSDFVSNSSSSSFVVLADENTPEIFKGTLLNFNGFRHRFFRRDIAENLEDSLTFFYRRGLDGVFDFSRITYMTPERFMSEYVKTGTGQNAVFSRNYPVLESDRDLVDKLRVFADENDKLNHPQITIYRYGKRDNDLINKAQLSVYGIQQKYKNKIQKTLDVIVGHFLDIVKDVMSDWKFWYVELDDGRESDGYDALDQVKWGRVFSNH